jgi:iron complex transport system ATP-binding protein
MVLVTHHVEEIPAGITDALLLADGRAVRSGPVDETITGDGPSAAFGMPIKVERRDRRWTAREG